MTLSRRRLLAGIAGAALLGPTRLLAARGPQQLLSCRSDHAGRHFATLFDADGEILLDVRLPARGHGIAISHDRSTAVVFARRPGDFIIVLDLVERREVLRRTSADDRHYYGHGVFTHDDALLYATENAFETGEGRIGVYDAGNGFRRIGEFDSQGIGPHELRLLGDGRTLVVANGGIRTHPDMPRAKLNLDSMRASLVYLDRMGGRLLETLATPERWQRLSIRHIDVAPDGLVAMAMQYEGARTDRPPLVATHRPGQSPRWLEAPDAIQRRMRNYCGSVAFERDGHRFAVSSPRGGLLTRWDAGGQFIDAHEQADVCGIAAGRHTLWTSDGLGGLRGLADGGHQFVDTRWDNHMSAF